MKEKKKPDNVTPAFLQYKPGDVYLGVKVTEERIVVSERKEITTQKLSIQLLETGNEPFDMWLNNMARYGFRTRSFHARQLGIDGAVLNALLLVFTGMRYADFVRELTYIMAKDLIGSNHYKHLHQVAEFLGYKAYSSLFRLMKDYEKSSPSGGKRISKEEQMKRIREFKASIQQAASKNENEF